MILFICIIRQSSRFFKLWMNFIIFKLWITVFHRSNFSILSEPKSHWDEERDVKYVKAKMAAVRRGAMIRSCMYTRLLYDTE